MKHYDERRLVSPELSSDLEWFLLSSQASSAMVVEAVAREYYAPVYHLALSLLNDPKEAEDAAWETLLAVPANRHLYASTQGIRTWLFSLTVKSCARKSSLKQASQPEIEASGLLWSAVDELDLSLRTPLLLRYVHRLSLDDIARVTGRPQGPLVRAHGRAPLQRLTPLHRARQALHRNLRQWLLGRPALAAQHSGPARSPRVQPAGRSPVAPLRAWSGHRRARRLIQLKLDETALSPQDQHDLQQHLESCEGCRTYALELAELESLLKRSLPARWQGAVPPGLDLESLPFDVEERLARRQQQSRALNSFQQIAMGGLVLVLVLSVGWVTNWIFPRSAAPLPAARTVVATRLVQVTPSAPDSAPSVTDAPDTPGSASLKDPLSELSDPEQIRRKMIAGRDLWKSLWAEAQIVRYGPAGYLGPPQVYRSQIWLEQPEQKMVLSGPSSREPEYVSFSLYDSVYEMDLTTKTTYYYRVGELIAAVPSGYRPVFLGLYGYDLRSLLDGSIVTRLLFPERAAENAQNLHHHGLVQVMGRQALVVDMRLEDGARHRVWVDALNGVALRWQRYDPTDPRTLVEEVILTSIQFEADFPDESYSSYFFDPERFVWENEWRPAQVEASMPAPPLEAPFGRSQSREQAADLESQSDFFAPGASGADRSRLTFQWQPEPDEFPDPTRPDKWVAREWSSEGWTAESSTELFAGDAYLGRVAMGDLWNLFCERSLDGSRIAFVNPPRGPQGLYMANAGPFWFDLSDPGEIHNALPNGTVVSSDFAFSPDGEWLAFWGCGGSEENCGIYLQNTRTLRTVKLLSLSFGAIFFTWSPDGESLAMMTAENTLLVVRARTGEVTYASASFDYLEDGLPPDSPTRAWGVPFPPERTGLEGCIQPPR